ncbi:carboxypeptidase Y-deficient [Borealophlyctis nickersoniae]|nr:carboxypeptidase Y-deficient [Borealophlyctis nickersoniae]
MTERRIVDYDFGSIDNQLIATVHRVCITCYTGRDGYDDTRGVSRNRTQTFLALRKVRVGKVHLEANKLEKRLEKLAKLYAEEPATVSKRHSISAFSGTNRRALDQSVVAWENDNAVSNCPLCQKAFGPLTLRRHHCRLCGRVVCGTETCSRTVPLVAEQAPEGTPPVGEILICQECNQIVFQRRNHAQQLANVPQALKLHQSVTKYRALVDEVLPKYNNLLVGLRNRANISYEDRDYQMAARYRKVLMDYFAELDKLAKQLKTLHSPSPTLRRIESAISTSIVQYLQIHMFTIQLLPKPVSSSSSSPVPQNVNITALVEAKQQLQVLETQEEQVRGFLDDAVRRRRFEEVEMLKESLSEVVEEVDRVRRVVRELEGDG